MIKEKLENSASPSKVSLPTSDDNYFHFSFGIKKKVITKIKYIDDKNILLD